MRFESDQYVARTGTTQAAIDLGLRQYMLRVYNYMATGLALTGIIAMMVASSQALMQAIFGSGLFWVVALAPLGIVFFMSFKIDNMKASTAQTLFWVYAAIMGVSMASIFMVYTGSSIARVFFITAGTFAGMSLYGYTTRKDLTSIGSFLIMGLIGIIIAGLVNIFLKSAMLQFAISALGVIIFVGLTAYDTQKIKEMYLEEDHPEIASKKAVMGALTLYMDFINLFIQLLRFFGDRR